MLVQSLLNTSRHSKTFQRPLLPTHRCPFVDVELSVITAASSAMSAALQQLPRQEI